MTVVFEEDGTISRVTPVQSEPLLDCRVTIGDCSNRLRRVISFLYLHVLAWRLLLRGRQDVTHLTTVTTVTKSNKN